MQSEKYILIVEDSPTQAEKLRLILEDSGYNVKTAYNGVAALEIIRLEKPLIIISDVIMPEMDGYELCRTLKDSDELRNIPFILLTALSDPKDVVRGLQAGADNFLTKPYNQKFLLSRVQYILANLDLRKNMVSDMGIQVMFAGQKYYINSDRIQIIDLLLSTYENAIQKNDELAIANQELMEIQREMAIKNKELEKLNAEKNKFIGIAAHDLRGSMGSILSSSILLEQEFDTIDREEAIEFLKLIRDSSDFVLGMINELLDVSVIESGQLKMKLTEFDPVELLMKNLQLHRHAAEQKQITLNFYTSENVKTIIADHNKLEQVFSNLISNAIKFSFQGKEVDVTLEDSGEKLLLTVKDQGLGIPKNEIGLLFKPFPNTSVRGTAGERSTGLGLMIAKKIIDAHGGTIWVESEQGKGSVFYVELPYEAFTYEDMLKYD